MQEAEIKGLQKLFEVSYFIAKKWRYFSDFKDIIELQKMHGVTFHGTSFKHKNACKDFIISIGDYFFMKDVKDKVERANFIAILNHGATDSAIMEQEVNYLVFFESDTFESRLAFFTVAELNSGQNAPGLKLAIEEAFQSNGLEVMHKVVFIGSDGASVNSGLKSGLIILYKREHK